MSWPNPATPTYEGTPCRRAGHTTRYLHGDHACVACEREDYQRGGKAAARKNLAKRREERVVALIIKQNGTCALCDEPIVGLPRLYAGHPMFLELDHIIPKSRGGNNAIDNMRVVTARCNNAKRALLDEEIAAVIARRMHCADCGSENIAVAA